MRNKEFLIRKKRERRFHRAVDKKKNFTNWTNDETRNYLWFCLTVQWKKYRGFASNSAKYFFYNPTEQHRRDPRCSYVGKPKRPSVSL